VSPPASVDHTDAYFALAGVVLAIGGGQIAAWRQRIAERARLERELAAQQHRLDLQLAAERERLDQTLAEERRRQSDALAHERYLRKQELLREELFAILTRAVETVAVARELVVSLENALKSPDDEAVRTAASHQIRKMSGTVVTTSRDVLSVRMIEGEGSPLARKLVAVRDVLRQMSQYPPKGEALTPEHTEQLRELDEQHSLALGLFSTAAADVLWRSEPPGNDEEHPAPES
jgi:hypothetical protein